MTTTSRTMAMMTMVIIKVFAIHTRIFKTKTKNR